MCTAFVEKVGLDWTCYAETAGWDILLVRNTDGFQIGVEAKQRLNATVLTQALERRHESFGPDCRAVLVPYGSDGGLEAIAEHCGLTVLRIQSHTNWRGTKDVNFFPALPRPTEGALWGGDWHESCPTKRCPLPEYVPDVVPGRPAPVQLTKWKIAALKVAALLELTGHVTRADFKVLGVDARRWITPGYDWLRPENGAFVAGPRLPAFADQHPEVYARVKADAEKWLPGLRPDWSPSIIPVAAEAVEPEGFAFGGEAPTLSLAEFMALQQRMITQVAGAAGTFLALERGGPLPAEHAGADLGPFSGQVPEIARATSARETTVRFILSAGVTAGLLPLAPTAPSQDRAAA